MLRETLATKVGLRRARSCQRGVQLPERLHARRHRLRARRHVPLRLGADPIRDHDLRAFPGLRQLRPGHPGGREAARAEQRPGPFRPARERPCRRRGCRGRREPRFEQSGPAPTQSRRLPRLGRTRPTTDQPSSAKLERGERRSRSGSVYADLRLRSGQLAVCTFRNVRLGSPAIAIDKVGPASATAGDTLRYQLFVRNPGDLPFPAASVEVVDPNCDDPPALVGKADPPGADATPRTLDPGDVWTYSCSKKTAAPEDCRPSVVTNTAVVTGEAGGSTVRDDSRVDTDLTCPPEPPEPPEPPNPTPEPTPQPPTPPSPVVPPGPSLPDADAAAAAGAAFRQILSRCIRGRAPRINLEGTRISRVRVLVNGRQVRALTVRALQRRLTPRVTLRPGRYRLGVRVTFQRGTGSPAVLLQATIRICSAARAARPPFTG